MSKPVKHRDSCCTNCKITDPDEFYGGTSRRLCKACTRERNKANRKEKKVEISQSEDNEDTSEISEDINFLKEEFIKERKISNDMKDEIFQMRQEFIKERKISNGMKDEISQMRQDFKDEMDNALSEMRQEFKKEIFQMKQDFDSIIAVKDQTIKDLQSKIPPVTITTTKPSTGFKPPVFKSTQLNIIHKHEK